MLDAVHWVADKSIASLKSDLNLDSPLSSLYQIDSWSSSFLPFSAGISAGTSKALRSLAPSKPPTEAFLHLDGRFNWLI